MPYYSKAEIARAREIDLLTYLQTYEPTELVHVRGNTYCTRDHDSLKISNGKWMWWSRKLFLPEKSETNLEVIRYLTGRGIDREIIKECIDETKLPIALENMTQNQTQINTIALHLDNDYAGRSAARSVSEQLGNKYIIRDEPPAYGKDCNDYIQHTIRQKHSRQMGRE